MKRVLIILSLVLVGLSCYSQNNTNTIGYANLSSVSGRWIKNVKETTNIKGSLYLFENWNNSGSIVTGDNKSLKIKGINYDTKSEQFVAKISTDSVYVFDKSYVSKVIINTRVFKKFQNGNKVGQSFYEIVVEGSGFSVLKKNIKVIKKGVTNPLSQVTGPDAYVNKSNYYVINKDNNAVQAFVLNKRNVLSFFGDKKSDVKKFMYKNNLSVKNALDLKRILRYYESI